ncbi:hypothetical protein [Dongia sp.]|uniref:hypothetical protein n=1 Tax=Dongia sp. TaxID=1977262 RepID=UPI0035B42266
MSERSNVIAALDLACLMQRLLVKPSRCTAEERKEVRTLSLRALAALNGHELPAGEAVDEATGRAAFEAVCRALVHNGISNMDIVTWFNDSASQRQQPTAR